MDAYKRAREDGILTTFMLFFLKRKECLLQVAVPKGFGLSALYEGIVLWGRLDFKLLVVALLEACSTSFSLAFTQRGLIPFF